MKKQVGLHFYINVVNFNQIILDEEKTSNRVDHAIHALDTFFASIERYGKRVSKSLVVEKITGSRLHLYILEELVPAFQVVKSISAYAYKLSFYLNKEISKFKTLKDFHINVGAAYGRFYVIDFQNKTGYSEITSIGNVANIAAKLQSISGWETISISEDIYEALATEEQKMYKKGNDDSFKKISNHDRYYTTSLVNVHSSVEEMDLQAAKEYANSENLVDIHYAQPRKLLDPHDLSKMNCKKLEGIPVYADIRGFTLLFKEDDSNLDEMARKTQAILDDMYQISSSFGGVHIQFQGDRELSLYHNVPSQMVNGVFQSEKKCFKDAVLASMRMIDAIHYFQLHIGIGADFGTMFATKIGARGEKDVILLGETVIQAETMEDKNADKDQIAITSEVFNGLKEDTYLANLFVKIGDYYVTTVGYHEYLRDYSGLQQSENTSNNRYNGAWGDIK